MSLPRRRLAALASAVAAALAVLLVLGSTAAAAETVKVEVRGIPGTMTAGSGSARFQATFTNATNAPITGIHAVVAVHLEGASPEMIRVQRQQGGDLAREPSSGGTVVFVDPEAFTLQGDGRSATRRYTLSFAGSAPDGQATITVAAVVGGQQVGSAGASTSVVRGRESRTTAPNTDPGYVPTFEAGPTYSLAPLPVAEEPPTVQASVPKSLYVLGSLLIIMGAGSLFLIFRPPGRVPARVTGAGPHRISPSWHPAAAAPQAWPTVPRPEPPRRPSPEPGPHTGSIRPVRDPGPHTGGVRRVRDPGPDEPLPPWLRP